MKMRKRGRRIMIMITKMMKTMNKINNDGDDYNNKETDSTN